MTLRQRTAILLRFKMDPPTKRQPLSPQTRLRVKLLFAPADRFIVEHLLINECGTNLPDLENLNQIELERFRFAALKLSQGHLDKLRRAIDLAQSDWRDHLMAADFGSDVTAHNHWLPANGNNGANATNE